MYVHIYIYIYTHIHIILPMHLSLGIPRSSFLSGSRRMRRPDGGVPSAAARGAIYVYIYIYIY